MRVNRKRRRAKAPKILPVWMNASIDVSIAPLSRLGDLESAWRDLEARSDAEFFLTWHWIGPWLATVRSPPFVLVARRAGRVEGLALLGYHPVRRHRGLVRVPTLHLNQSGLPEQDVTTIEYNGILTDKTSSVAVWQACVGLLMSLHRLPDGRRIDAVAWNGARECTMRRALGPHRARWRTVAEAPSAAVDLAAIRASGLPFLQQISANTRRQVRRAMALYEERHGPLQLEVARDVAEAHAWFHAAGVLHQARWEPRGKPGAFAYPFYVRFHERVIADGLPARVVELARISAGTMPIGYLYNFLFRGRVYYYFSGFRYEGDNRLKPGLVSHTMCIERYLARDIDVYDFMAGDNRYKTSLGRPGPRMVGVVAERSRLDLRLEAGIRAMKHWVDLLVRQG